MQTGILKKIFFTNMVAIGIVSSLPAQQETSERHNAVRPNILMIITDQQTASALSAAGNKDLKTPNIDFLAAHGTRFTRAYDAQPLCTPSRTSILTGRYPHQTGITVNGGENATLTFPDSIQMLGKYLQRAGYRTGYIGKWHIPVKFSDTAKHGFDVVSNTATRDFSDGVSPADFASFVKENNTKPFLAIVSFLNPHDINEWARNDFLKMDIVPPVPGSSLLPDLPANFSIAKDEPEIVRQQQSSNIKTYPATHWTDNHWRAYRWAYNRLVESVDANVGRIIAALKKYGQLDNTILFFTSDHGDGYAAHHWNQKQILYEESINVPFIISQVNTLPARMDAHLINTGLDLFPTICGIAGIKLPNTLSGKNILPLLADPHTSWRDTLVVETEFADNNKSLGIKGRSVITNDWKYIVYDQGYRREQLFFLKSDPGETHNLANDRKYDTYLKNFRTYLKSWIIATKDSFLLHY